MQDSLHNPLQSPPPERDSAFDKELQRLVTGPDYGKDYTQVAEALLDGLGTEGALCLVASIIERRLERVTC